jgi:aspartate-semialdehyde dehydrogenase
MPRDSWRIALAGAGGALGREIAAVMAERRLPLAELLAFGTDRSAGETLDWLGEEIAIGSEPPRLAGLDLLVLATPQAAALEWVREALRAEVPVLDCSGSLAISTEVPMVHADLGVPPGVEGVPALCQPAGPVLVWAPALAAVNAVAGLRGVAATWLRSASGVGAAGPDRLSEETVALLTHQDAEDADIFPGSVAFDCVPLDDANAGSDHILRDLGRLLATELRGGVQAVQVPSFVADGGVLWLETERPLSEQGLRGALEKAAGVDLRADQDWGPSVREAAGADQALVGHLRAGGEGALAGLWVAGDGVRLAARNAVRLAEARLSGPRPAAS